MKKAFIIVFLAIAFNATSQPIWPRQPHLFYYWWYEDLFSNPENMLTLHLLGSIGMVSYPYSWTPDREKVSEAAIYMNTDTALTIVGINWMRSEVEDVLKGDTSESGECQIIKIYEIEGDSLILLAERDVCRDIVFPKYKIPIDTRRYEHSRVLDSCIMSDLIVYNYLREYYFDTPIIVRDSFYLAWDYPDPIRSHAWAYSGVNTAPCQTETPFPLFKYKIKTFSRPNTWQDTEMPAYPFGFPIINYESRFAKCTPIEDLHVNWQSNRNICFVWCDTIPSHLGWEFSYAEEGQSPDDGDIIPCSTASVQITIQPGTHYVAYVRPLCVGNRHGDWSIGVPFHYNAQEITPLKSSTIIAPNPNTGLVTIQSPYRIQRVDVFDISGVLIDSIVCSSETEQINLSEQTHGTYLLKIHTSEGIVTHTIVRE